MSNARGPLSRLQQEITAAIAGLSAEQLSQHAPGKWCAAEILEHLYLTYTGSIKGFSRVLEAGKPLAAKATWKQRGQALVVVSFSYLPSGREAPSMARPRGLAPEKVVAEIEPKIAEMNDIIGPLTGSQWRKFHLVHGRHHVKQILALRREMKAAK